MMAEHNKAIRNSWIIISNLTVLLLINCCSSPTVPKSRISCDFIYDKEKFSECLARANSGDANAAFNIAKLYDKGKYTSRGLSIKKDRRTAFYWYKVSAGLGHEKALRIVFDSYYFGRHGPENKMEAERYLRKSENLGHEWAMLVVAHGSEKNDPEKAMDLYFQLAIKDNCHAQRKLAKIYFEGKLVPQDLCKSYFWALLASAGGMNRRSDHHHLAEDLSGPLFPSCSQVIGEKIKAELQLGPKYVQMVQDAASRWQAGQAEPSFPIVRAARGEKPAISKIRPPDSLRLSKSTDKERSYTWFPASIDINRRLKKSLPPSEIFDLVNTSVWTVISASTVDNLKAMNNISLASAVAITDQNLLTNYHVIEKSPYVVVKHGERFAKAMVISGDKQTDRCILKIEKATATPVKGFRKYNTLNIGETVYSVGSPKGLENTLGKGIISGKRELYNLKLIQTTAQISKGSSGGGLFDSFGNLIGITTFKIVESEGLNFAISIEDFSQ
jgi:hypothetical protein